jgi:putative transposase
MLTFLSVPNSAPEPGMVLRLAHPDVRYLRVTHRFSKSVYVIWVGEPKEIRQTRRPVRKSLVDLEELVRNHGGEWGQLRLPAALTTAPAPDSKKAHDLNVAWELISPLIDSFEHEANLARTKFTSIIRARALEKNIDLAVLSRLLIRYYYFGKTRLGLLSLPRGTKPGDGGYINDKLRDECLPRQPRRRGRKTSLARELGDNTFVVSKHDIEDMVSTFTSLLRAGPTHKSNAHERYLAGAFRKRYPELYVEYISGKRVEPVTARQYRYYIDRNAQMSEQLAENVRSHRRNTGHLGSVLSAGPGEVYEIDATGGRFYLVSADDPPVHLGKPTIYLLVDRWSRFVVSAYMSLKAPSYEEVKHALLVAFTSRARRFGALGVDIDDERWPVGRMPAVICPDRGSDFMSRSMEQAVVQDLRIELTPLPPYCPDGKAIVERFIREVKRRMAASGMKGTYADRPLDPTSKRAARRAQEAAVHSLAEAYRSLIEIIHDHNNRPHTALRKRRMLAQAGVQPTPKAAYLWGLENITGLRKAPFTDEDYKRLLMSTDSGSLAGGVLRYRQRPYLPIDEVASEMSVTSTNRSKAITVRVDKSDPSEVFIVNSQGQWAAFGITKGGGSEISGLTLDEEEMLSTQTSLLWARSEHESRVARVASLSPKAKSAAVLGAASTTKVGKKLQNDMRANETALMKAALLGKPTSARGDASIDLGQDEWLKHEEEERLRTLEVIRKNRRER